MSNQSLVGTLPIYAQHLAELTGVKVHVEGIQAKSGSMKSAIDQAEAAVYAVLSALEGLPLVTTGAMSFPNKANDGVERCALIKSPKERLIRAVSEGGFVLCVRGGLGLRLRHQLRNYREHRSPNRMSWWGSLYGQ